MNVERIISREGIISFMNLPCISKWSGGETVDKMINLKRDLWLGVYVGDLLVGMWIFEPINSISLSAHCYFMPEHRKLVAKKSYKKAMNLAFGSHYKKVIVKAESSMWHVKGFCLACGFRLEGKTEKSSVSRGRVVDEYILGITKQQYLESIKCA